jgi:epoxyqueuosine reductase
MDGRHAGSVLNPDCSPYDPLVDQSSSQQLGADLIERARSLGFAAAGIAGIEPSDYASGLRRWLDEGMHGSMAWMENYFDKRTDPAKLIDHARSILVVADVYASRSDNVDPPIEAGHGKIARYARGKDYHKGMKKRLMVLADQLREQHPDASFKVFVDTAPVPERELAQRAGIGWVAKHTLIIHPKLGSYLFLGGIVMTLDASPPSDQPTITNHCGSCTACIAACPTDAITDHQVDARRCISYLTIEHRDPIEPELASKMGDWIYGCDICQEVCPHNSPKPDAEPANPAYQSQRWNFDLLEVIGWTEDDRREAFKGSAMKRAKLAMMHRNAQIVAINQGIELKK